MPQRSPLSHVMGNSVHSYNPSIYFNSIMISYALYWIGIS